MPDRHHIQNIIQRLFHRSPALQAGSLRVLDLWYQLALLPYRRRRRRRRHRAPGPRRANRRV